MQTTNNTRRYPLILPNQGNAYLEKMKMPVSKTSGQQNVLRSRTAFSDISSNVQQPQVQLVGKPLINDAKEKKPSMLLKPQAVKSYKNVPAKIDSRIPHKSTTLTAKDKSSLLQNKENINARSNIPEKSIRSGFVARTNEIKTMSTTVMRTRSTIREEKESLKIFESQDKDIDALENHMKKLEPAKTSRRLSSYSTGLLAENVKDIDAAHEKSTILMSIYVKDIYAYLHELEMKYRIRPKHLEGHVVVTSRMRELLIDWLIEVHFVFNLLLETLHMTIAIVDRYLQIDKSVKKTELQLLGVTAMFIASKYEEMFAPDISDFVQVTDHTYTKHEIIEYEKNILVKLDFSFGRPLPVHFLRRFVKAADLTVRHHSLCKYLIELGLLSYDLAHCHPSEIAAAAICLSIALLSSTASFKDCWNNTLTFYSGYTYEHISEVVESLAQLLNNVSKSKLKAATKKYNDSKFKKIASSPELQFVKVCLDNLSKNNNFKDRPKPLYVI